MKELKIGSKAPSFSLLAVDEGKVERKATLKDYLGKSVILFFYPKDLTSGCTVEACDFRDSLSILKKKKAVVLGVSKDSVASHFKFRDKHQLNFPLLSDPEGKVCEAYGVWKEKSLYGRKYLGIERTTFVIDPAGKIARIYSKVRVAGHIQMVLAEL